MEGVSQKPVEPLCGFGDCANSCAVERHAPVEPVGRQRRPTRKVQVGVCHEELRPAQPSTPVGLYNDEPRFPCDPD
jgi:hypothetical protein